MPLITQVCIPERFTSGILAGYALEFLKERPRWAVIAGRKNEQMTLMNAIQFGLDRLKAEGVLN